MSSVFQVFAPRPRTHGPDVALRSGPFSHSQLTSSLVALRVAANAASNGLLLHGTMPSPGTSAAGPEVEPDLTGRDRKFAQSSIESRDVVLPILAFACKVRSHISPLPPSYNKTFFFPPLIPEQCFLIEAVLFTGGQEKLKSLLKSE